MDIVKSNKIAYIISLFIGSLVYWSIVSNVIHTAYAITLSAVGYVICLLFLITHFNEYALNSNNSVMERYYSDRMSVCPKCGNMKRAHFECPSCGFYKEIKETKESK